MLVLEGRSNAAIARARGVSVPTVATQVSSVFQKLGTCGRTEHVALLLRDDLKPARGAASWSIARPFARLLGVSRMTLITKMKRHGIKQDENGNGDDFDEDDGDDSDVAPCTLTVSVTLRPLRESAPRSTPWPPPSRGSPRRTRSVSVRRR